MSQLGSNQTNGSNNPFTKTPFCKMACNCITHIVPKCLSDMPVDAAVAKDSKFAVGKYQENQYTVLLFSLMQPMFPKYLRCLVAYIDPGMPQNDDLDLC